MSDSANEGDGSGGTKVEKTYIGDGVYASFDGHMIKLETQRENSTDVIYLEPSVYNALTRFAAKSWGNS